MMTRNDFELLARHLKAINPTPQVMGQNDYCDGYNAAINQICGACSTSNSRFDIDRFKQACGV